LRQKIREGKGPVKSKLPSAGLIARKKGPNRFGCKVFGKERVGRENVGCRKITRWLAGWGGH